MRLVRFLPVLVALAAIASTLLAPRRADPLPLFARKYEMPCTQCHLAFPRLNAFGYMFRQNGYRMPATVGESPWEDKVFPLSLIGNVGYTMTSTDAVDSTGRRVRRNVGAFVQNTVEFHSAGTLGPRITAHFDNNFAGIGAPLESGMAFVQFDDLAKDGSALNLKLGIYDAEIPYLSDSRRTTWTHYLSPITLGGEGFELNGMKSGWTYALGLDNSARTHGKPGDKTLNNLENPYLWLMRDLRGHQVAARVFLDRQDPRDSTKSGSLHTQAELNACLNGSRWLVIPGVTYERFSDADATLFDPADYANGAHERAITLLLEGLVFLDKNQRWPLTARYELRHLPSFSVLPEEDDLQLVANVSCYLNPNVRVGAEWTHNRDNVAGPRIETYQAFVHVGY